MKKDFMYTGEEEQISCGRYIRGKLYLGMLDETETLVKVVDECGIEYYEPIENWMFM